MHITPFDTPPDPLKSKSNVVIDSNPGQRDAITAPEQAFFGIEQLMPAASSAPKGSDVHPLVAHRTVAAHSHELDMRPIECIVGERIDFVRARPHDTIFVGAVWEIARAPAVSSAKMDGHRFTCDAPGCFVVACTLGGGWRREIVIAAFPAEALDGVGYLPSQQLEKRMRLREICRDPNVTRESIVSGLEGPAIDLATLAGYTGKKRGGFSVEKYR